MKIFAPRFLFNAAWRRCARFGMAVYLSLVVVTLPARACCDDFLSCAAAAATGGLSCVVEAAYNALREIISEVEHQRDATVNEFNATLDEEVKSCTGQLQEITTEINQLLARIQKAGVDGGVISSSGVDLTQVGSARMAAESGGAESSVGTARIAKSRKGESVGPASQLAKENLDDSPSLAGAKAELAALVAEKKNLIEEIKKQEAEVLAQELATAEWANSVFKDTFINQADRAISALNDFLSHPLDFAADGHDAMSVLEAAGAGFADVVMPALKQAKSDLDGVVQVPLSFLATMEKQALRADELVAAIQKMTAVHSEAERMTIVAKMEGTTMKPPAVRLATSHRPLTRTVEGLKSKFADQFAGARAAFEKLSAPHAPMETATIRAKLAGDFDTYFKGVPAATARKKRNELLAEAKARYAKDPATLKALEKYLKDEARARGVD